MHYSSAIRIGCLATLLLTLSCASYTRLAEYATDYPDHEAFFDNAGIPLYEGAPPRFYYDGSVWQKRSLQLIEEAQDYILILSFLLTEHESGREIFHALKRKMEEGVRVYCITDSASYYRTYPRVPTPIPASIPYLRELGIPVIEYNSIRGRRVFGLTRLFNRDHRKFWVIDGKSVLAGGMNIDYDSIRPAKEGGSIDAMVEVNSPGVTAALVDSFITTWNAFSAEKLHRQEFAIRADGNGTPVRVFDQGLRPSQEITTLFDGLFTFSRESIWMVQCYAFLTPALMDKLEYAVHRGVDVNIIMSANHISPRFEKASYYSIQDLLDRGITVYIFESPTEALLHYKLILSDNTLAAIGSANYNLRSQTLSRELTLLFEDQNTAASVKTHLEELLLHCRKIDQREARSYRTVSYLFNYLLMQFWG